MILAFAVRTYGVYVRITAFAVANLPRRVGPACRVSVSEGLLNAIGAMRRKPCVCGKVRVRTYAVAVASARTRYHHCCVSRLLRVFRLNSYFSGFAV